jgi:hypothetical protein
MASNTASESCVPANACFCNSDEIASEIQRLTEETKGVDDADRIDAFASFVCDDARNFILNPHYSEQPNADWFLTILNDKKTEIVTFMPTASLDATMTMLQSRVDEIDKLTTLIKKIRDQ